MRAYRDNSAATWDYGACCIITKHYTMLAALQKMDAFCPGKGLTLHQTSTFKPCPN